MRAIAACACCGRPPVVSSLTRLFELLDQTVDVGHLRTRAERDALATRTVEQVGIAAFPPRHRADDRVDARQIFFGIWKSLGRRPDKPGIILSKSVIEPSLRIWRI